MKSLRRIFPILAVLFLGYLGYSLALPIFPPLFLNLEHSFLSPETSSATRRILLGILFSMYPIGQFIGAPIMGSLSDKYGRKPVLLISLLLVIPAYIGCALAVILSVPWLLYLSRFLSGLFEGNITIAQAAISDISKNTKEKTEHFGWMVSLSSSAFIFGPLIGGSLADSKLISWFHYDTPFWGGAFLVLLGFIIVWYYFRETRALDPDMELEPFKIFDSLGTGFRLRYLHGIFAANLSIYLSIFFFLNFFTAYLVNVFGFTISQLGQTNAYLALFTVTAPFFFGKLAKMWPSKRTMLIGSFLMAISLVVFPISSNPWSLIFTLIPIGFCMALGFAFPAIMISDAASKKSQGQALGTNQALQVFAEGATALLGGFLMASFNSLPIWAGAAFAFIGGFILMKLRVKTWSSSS